MKSKIFAAGAGASMALALVLRTTLRVPVSDEITPPALVASLPSLWVWIVAIGGGSLLGILVGRWLQRYHAADALFPLWILGLAALAYIPGLLRLLPLLSAFSGAFLDLVLIGCVTAAVWRGLSRVGFRISPGPYHVAVFSFILFVALGYRIQETVGISGDEPHYLLIAYSLIHDGDLAVADNYAAEDHRHYFNGKIGPHLAHGSPYSVHGVGLPLLLLPGFALLGLRGVLLTEALLGAFLVRELFLAIEDLDAGRPAALLGAVGFAGTAPALFLCVSAYPELPVALVVIASARRVVVSFPPRWWVAFGWGLGFGLLPFFHVKYIPLALVLGLGAMWFWRRYRWWAAAGEAVGLLGLVVFFAVVLGNPNPLASYGTQRVFVERIPLGLAGLFFDQEFGLLPHSPFYLVCLMAVGSLVGRRVRLAVWTLAILAAVALPGAAHPLWSGGTSPPARFLFPGLPLLAVAGAAAWSWQRRRETTQWLRTLVIVSLLLGAFMALGPGQPLYLNQRDGSGSVWVALGSSWDLNHYLPSLVRADDRSIVLAIVGTVFVLIGCLAHWGKLRLVFPPVGILVFAGAVLLDVFSPGSVAEGARARWMTHLLKELPEWEGGRFLSLPSATPLSHSDVVDLVNVPLGAARPIHVPAGEYELEGDPNVAVQLCNGEGCFGSTRSHRRFETRLALARFHVRSEQPSTSWELIPRSVSPSTGVALRTLDLSSGARLHGLDDNAFLDPKGYWVHTGAQARFALEGDGGPIHSLSIVNGGRENWVELSHHEGTHRFRLGPGEGKQLEVPLEEGVSYLSVTSTAGFRPSELDPTKEDLRPLGVFVTFPESRPE